MNNSQFIESMIQTFGDCIETAKKKNQDYAGDADPFANFSKVETFGICSVETGILVRITDKMARISNLLSSDKDPAVIDESIDDTIMDAINYFAILKAYRESQQGKVVDPFALMDQTFDKAMKDFKSLGKKK